MRVLIVDDRTDVRERLLSLLRDVRQELLFFEASSAASALRAFYTHKPDVVLLDVHLGATNGLNLLPRFKERVPPPCVCVMTSFPTAQHLRASVELGADLFVDKSRDFAKLIELLLTVRVP